MSEEDVAVLLEKLARAEARLLQEEAAHADAVDAATPSPVKKALARLSKDHEASVAPIKSKIETLRQRVKEACVEFGATVTAEGWQAVFYGPQRRWDSKKLEGMIAFHPEIEKACTMSEPSCQIRKAKDK